MAKQLYERPVIQRINPGMPGKHGGTPSNGSLTHIDGVSVDSLVAQFGSPLFVISETTLRNTFRDAQRAFSNRYPRVQFAWSYKTNYLKAVCNAFHQEGAWAEVVSGFEYRKALEAGVPGNCIIYNGPDKSREDLQLAITQGSLIQIDNSDELSVIRDLATKHTVKPRVGIRVNLDTGSYPQWDRFGFNLENGEALEAIQKIASDANLSLESLHCHIGTFVAATRNYAIAAARMASLACEVKSKHGIAIRYLDLGGGFASTNTLKGSYLQGSDTAPTFDQYADAICSSLLGAGIAEDELPVLVLETGRALIDQAGYLISSVMASKRLADGRRATILDAGVNVLFTSFWYDHQVSLARAGSDYLEDTVLYGPLCMNIDVLREHISLPPLSVGDKLVFHTVGAYNMTQWMQFITLRPAVVMITGSEQAMVIRRRETAQDVSSAEQLPPSLHHFKLK